MRKRKEIVDVLQSLKLNSIYDPNYRSIRSALRKSVST